MKAEHTNILVEHKHIIGILLVTALILFVPLVAMQFTDEVVWNWFDFAAAGTLLIGTGLMIELVGRKIEYVPYRITVSAALVVGLLLIWAQLAVGLIGS
jgi:hypothetical protein